MNNIKRCAWCTDDPLYIHYHDNEWGKQVRDENVLFEFIVLESAQAGLSWLTILKRRELYRNAYDQFCPKKVAGYGPDDVHRLLNTPGIIRNKAKIIASINNARIFVALQQEFGSVYAYLYSFLPAKKPIVNAIHGPSEVPVYTEIAEALSADLKKRGFKFWGPVICYAYMQAVGMVNDHENSCSVKNRA